MTPPELRFTAEETPHLGDDLNGNQRFICNETLRFVNSRIDAYFKDAMVVRVGFPDAEIAVIDGDGPYRALLVGVEKIQKGVTKEEIAKMKADMNDGRVAISREKIANLLDRIETEWIA